MTTFDNFDGLAGNTSGTLSLPSAPATPAEPAAGARYLFIEGSVPDQAMLAQAATDGVHVVVLDPNSDGLAQIAAALHGVGQVAAIGIVSHGDDGVLTVGATVLTGADLAQHQAVLHTIGASLAPGADIALYGCDIGKGSAGAAFIAGLASATGAVVAASSDDTGAAALGGNWTLEVSTGTHSAAPLLDASKLANYDHLLATQSIDNSGLGALANLKAAIATDIANGVDDTITLTVDINFATAADTIDIADASGHSITIIGGNHTIDGKDLTQVLHIASGSTVILQNLTITDGLVAGNGGDAGVNGADANDVGGAGQDALGGAIYNAGTLTISGSTISNSKAAGGGGAGGLATGAGGAGGGGGGYGVGVGGSGGAAYKGMNPGMVGTTGHGGAGAASASAPGGAGGSISGGVGGANGSYTSGGAGGTADAGSGVSIGGGGGGAGYSGVGGAGGHAVGGIYNSGTLTITTSAIINNIGAGGGGGGGGGSSYAGKAGGNGGYGVGGLANHGGTVTLDAATNTSLATGNKAGGGVGGISTGTSGTAGAVHDQSLGTITIATSPPVVSAVSQSSGDGYYNVSYGTVLVNVTFDHNVTVDTMGGVPRLLLETGTTDQYASYFSGSGSTALTFKYLVQAGDTSADLQYENTTALELHGGTITLTSDGSTLADLTLPALSSASSLAGSSAVIIDTTAPAGSTPDLVTASDTGSSSTDNLTKNTTPTFTGTTEANAGVVLYDTNGTTALGNITADGSGNWSIAASSLGEGMHTIYTKVTDVASNVSALSTGLTVTVDVTAPAIGTPDLMNASDSGVSSSDNLTNKTTPTFTGTAEASSTVTLYDTDGSTVLGTTTANGMGKWSIASSLLSEGAHMIGAKATDAAGNVSALSSKLTVTIDTTAPATAPDAPTLDSGTDSGVSNSDGITSVSGPCFNGTGANANSWVNVYADGSLLGTTLADGSGNYTYSATFLADGSHAITAKNVDNAGNIGTASSALTVTIAQNPPTTTIATTVFSNDTGVSATDFITNTAAQTISGTMTANLTAIEIVEVSLDNGGSWTTATTATGGNTWSLAGRTLTGSDTLQVRVSDLAGNAGTAATQAYVLDTTAPTATIATVALSADTGSSNSDFITRTASQTVSGTLFANLGSDEVVSVSLDNGSTWHTASATVGTKMWSLSGQTLSASNILKVHVEDTAGNAGANLSQAYVFDTAAPTTTVSSASFSADTGASSTDFLTKTAAQVISGTLSANLVIGESVEVSLDNGSTWTRALTSLGSNTWSLGSQTLTGSDTLQVHVIDTAGNASAPLSQAYVLDTTAPSAPSTPDLDDASDSGDSNVDNITAVTTPTINGTAEANATVTLYDSDGTTVLGTTTASGGGSWSIVSAALGGGVHTLTAKTTDLAGNTGVAATPLSITVDTAGPTTTVSSVQLSADTGASSTDFITKTAAQTITGTLSTALVAGQHVEVSLDNGGSWISTTATTGDSSFSYGTTLSASNTLKVRVVDVAGAGGTAYSQAYVLDHTAPSVAITSSVSTLKSGETATITFTFSENPGATFSWDGSSGDVTVSGGTLGAISGAGLTRTATFTPTASTNSGTASITVAAASYTDTAGNNGGAGTTPSLHFDTLAPVVSTPVLDSGSDSGPSNADHITNVTSPLFTGTAEAGAIVTLYDTDGTTVLGSTTATSGSWSITASSMSAGSHTVSVKASDAGGNVGTSSGLAVQILTAAPTLTITSDKAQLGVGETATVTFTFSSDPGASFAWDGSAGDIAVTGGTLAAITGSGLTRSAVFTPASGSSGAASISVTAASYTDLAGNAGMAGATPALSVDTVVPPPTTPTPVTVDGVPVTVTPEPLPGGGTGSTVSVPVVTSTRVDTTGGSGVADIPLATSGATTVLLAQIPIGYGLTSTGGASTPAGSAQQELLAAIRAATPTHDAGDQGHLTGNGVAFLAQLAGATPLLVQTIVISGGGDTPNAPLHLTGTSSATQQTALVIDTSHMPVGGAITLSGVDFAAIIGAASVTGLDAGQILTGDSARQSFSVAGVNGAQVFAGGGADTLSFTLPLPAHAAADGRAGAAAAPAGGAVTQTLLHGGADNDTVVFAGTMASYTINYHDGYELIASKANPTLQAMVVNVETLQFDDATVAVPERLQLDAISGLYQAIMGRQADVYGFDYWGTAQKQGATLGQIALQMLGSAEGAGHVLGAVNGNAAHDVELLYNAILGRHSDAAGLAFWVDVLAHGATLQNVASGFVQSVEMVGHYKAAAQWDFTV